VTQILYASTNLRGRFRTGARWAAVTLLSGSLSSCAAYGPIQDGACMRDVNIIAKYREYPDPDKILVGGYVPQENRTHCYWGKGTYLNAEPLLRCSRAVGDTCAVLMRGDKVVFEAREPFNWDSVLAPLAVGAVMFGAYESGKSRGISAPVSQTLPNRAAPASQTSTTLCPNGAYVAGNGCQIAPDGSYVASGRPVQIAPNGTYTSGAPRIAPDGTYVGGTGLITLCPNGNYVAGICHIAPNGKYVGDP
jgi:hypothetical protein